MNPKLPNIILLLICAVLIIAGVYFFFRTKEKIDENKAREAGNWFTNLFKSSSKS